MTLREQVYVHAVLLAGTLTDRQRALLETVCTAVTASLSARLREGITPDDCKADFIAAASLLAVAVLSEADEDAAVEQITAGDLTIRKGSRDAAANCLRNQAELVMTPYMKDSFSFRGV